MLYNQYPTVAAAAKALRHQGFTVRLRFKNDQLLDTHNRRSYSGKACRLCKYFRIPPKAAPGQTTTVYALRLPDGRLGTVASNEKRNDDFSLAVFMDKITMATRATS